MHANSAIQNLRKQAEVGIFFWKLNGYSFKGVFPVTSKLKESLVLETELKQETMT